MSAGLATVSAPSNIALLKYWGARDLSRAIPENQTLSMTLDRCRTITTAEFDPASGEDAVWLVDDAGRMTPPSATFIARVRSHLDRLRAVAGKTGRFRIATRNTFPMGAGIASSASGFAALTLAALEALGQEVAPARASELARESGSGSAARSVFGGYVIWPTDLANPESPARVIAPASHWDLRDVIVIVDSVEKHVASIDGHRRARSSVHFPARLEALPVRLDALLQAIAARDLGALGPVLEEEAIELHAIAMTSRPPIFYWRPGTLRVLEAVRALRNEGVGAWFTMDAGPNVHVLCEPAHEPTVAERLARVEGVESVLRDGVGDGPRDEEASLLT